MTPDYFHDLAVLKSTFLSGDEASIITSEILRHNRSHHISLLDVGTGPGRALISIVQGLRTSGRVLTVDAVDVFFAESIKAELHSHGITTHKIDFMKYHAINPVDVVMAIHSLYYFSSLTSALNHMARHLRPGALAIIVVWDDDCILRRVADGAFGTHGCVPLSPGDVLEILMKLGFSVVSDNTVTGGVSIERWLESPETIKSIATVLSRQLSPTLEVMRLQRFAEFASGLMPGAVRKNRIIFAQR